MQPRPDHIEGETTHARRGSVDHRFRYSVDYVLIDAEARSGPLLFSRNRLNIASLADRDHGGAPRKGQGVQWARDVLADWGLPSAQTAKILLLAQPRFLGYIFNPVSFWLAFEGDALVAAIAEVNNTFGDRHCYVCARPGFAPIRSHDRIEATKLMHVSPFQDTTGTYRFAFDIAPERLSILIAYRNGSETLHATLTGARRPLTNGGILRAATRRPLGALRTSVLIYYQALRLRLKGARYRTRPTPPSNEVS